jgi:hypothetical protein
MCPEWTTREKKGDAPPRPQWALGTKACTITLGN